MIKEIKTEKAVSSAQERMDELIKLFSNISANALGVKERLIAKAINSLPAEKVENLSGEDYSRVNKCALMKEMMNRYDISPYKTLKAVTDYGLEHGEDGIYLYVKNVHLDMLK